MESIFALVKALGNNNVGGVVKLLKDGLFEGSGKKEDYFRSLFKGLESIESEQFTAAMRQFGDKYGNTMEQMTDKLMMKAPPVLRQFNSDRDIPVVHQSTCSTETETELSNEHFH
ncbi:unnamed protein product [Arctia plantaginis]|uniref:Uncharacterized protein n=1 Tax=Arctia plantaginis TaxID=874455 RepID=A0A8S1B4I6_ARCPL|nr:unnamed protein product [Arctia plantaginis]CAB3254467.1 unnamed protein product [Arctia plantaginis]